MTAVAWLTFGGYVTGRAAPNHDFFGSYATAAHAWWGHGSFFAPPSFLPYTFGGTPAHLDLQSSGWYVPVGVLARTVDVTPHSLAALQAVTIWFGALGVLVLCRCWHVSRAASTLAALAWLFAPGFTSNAQHVDIVRAWAMLPWLLSALSVVPRRWWAYPLAVLLWFQFFVGAYPGNIAAAAYICAAWLLVVAVGLGRTETRHLGLWVACTVLPALLLSGVKWVPFLASRPHGLSGNGVVVNADILATFLFHFAAAGLPNDVSMRSFFVATPLLILALLADGRQRLTSPAVAMVFTGAVLGIDAGPTAWQEHLPLLDISRFRTVDFKLGIVLGIVLLGAVGADRVLSQVEADSSRRRALARGALATLTLSLLTLLGLSGAHQGLSVRLGLIWLTVSTSFVVMAYLASRSKHVRPALRHRASFALVALCLTAVCLQHAKSYPDLWHVDRLERETAYWGAPVSKMIASRAPALIEQRPARSAPSFPIDSPAELLWQGYNRAEFSRQPTLGGGVNLKGQPRYEQLLATARAPSGAATMRLLAAPGQGWVVGGRLPERQKQLTDCVRRQSCTERAAVVRPLEWGPGHMSFDVTAPTSGTLVLNEVAWPGWKATACAASSRGPCSTSVLVSRHDRLLLTAPVERGHQRITLSYETPHSDLSWLIFAAGGVTVLITTGVRAGTARRRVRYLVDGHSVSPNHRLTTRASATRAARPRDRDRDMQ